VVNPTCNEVPPDISQTKDILKKLLAIELERLDTAVQIEKERKIVFPETTIIIHDIQKLNEAINGRPVREKRPRYSIGGS
jgi:hypothetical protein